jgi:hypothetical protein
VKLLDGQGMPVQGGSENVGNGCLPAPLSQQNQFALFRNVLAVPKTLEEVVELRLRHHDLTDFAIAPHGIL